VSTDPLPRLRDPIAVVAFEGWNDAGDAATDAVDYLETLWQAKPIVEIASDDYYDFQVTRPHIKQIDGVTREMDWPSVLIASASPPGSARDVVLVRSVEPNYRWRAYCAELLEKFTELGVDSVVILGAMLADTPHTRPVPVTGAGYDDASARKFGLEQNRYEGPTGITGVLQDTCVRAGLPSISLWAAVPHYVSQAPNAKATVALLQHLEQALDLSIDLGELPEQAREWEASVSEMTADDPEIGEYIEGLEQRGDEAVQMRQAAEKVDGDALAAEFEKYLRRHGPGAGP
jgi:proteasome assembly chaperone (PAC2) family protein